MNINQRVREVRQNFNLTQRVFADRLGLKHGAISKIEKDGSTVTEQNKQIICDKFGISRQWLETGEGEMYEPKNQDSMFKSLREHYGMNDAEEEILQAYFEIDVEHRRIITESIKSLVDKIVLNCRKPYGEEQIVSRERCVNRIYAKSKCFFE